VNRIAKRVVFSTDDTAVPVTITYPDPMEIHEVADLREFLTIWLKGLDRRANDSARAADNGSAAP